MGVWHVDFVYGLIMAAAGAVLAWAVAGRAVRKALRQSQAESAAARLALVRLHHLTLRMAADVGQHNDAVQGISDELLACGTPDAELIVNQVARIVDVNQQMHQRLSESERQLEEQAQLIETQAAEVRTDALTRLLNRRGFAEELNRRAAEFKRHGARCSLIMLDLDHFKRLNDRWGHPAGDDVLRAVSGILRKTMRQIDIVARYGGEEFAILLPHTSLNEARIAAQRARRAIAEKPFRFDGHDIDVTASLGVAELLANEHHSLLVRRADAALYAAKQGGRNATYWHDGRQALPVDASAEPAAPPAVEPVAPPAKILASPPPVNPQEPARAQQTPAPVVNASPALPPVTPREAAPPTVPSEAAAASEAAAIASRVANRTEFCRAVQCRLGEWKRGGARFSVVLLSVLDHQRRFAAPTAAEPLLHALLRGVSAALREMDLVAEFRPGSLGVLLPVADGTEALTVAQRLRQSIATSMRQFLTDADPSALGTAAGIAEVAEGDDMVRLLTRAEEALRDAAVDPSGGYYWHNGHWTEPAANAAFAEAV